MIITQGVHAVELNIYEETYRYVPFVDMVIIQ